ncbi:MAG: DUF1456 family protein [Nitrospirae bacterium]|nr:DUF1456 family protein [Nitrospirota bacterium]
MTNNDILRRLRYALDINDSTMIGIFKLAGHELDQAALTALLKKEFDEGYVECDDKVMGSFLDGLIIHKRGRKETAPDQPKKQDSPLTNNAILKKLRIALELKEDDMIAVLNLAGVDISGHELNALFRKAGHRNYKECGDQFLRNFLKGLTVRYRDVDSYKEK